MFKRFGSKSDVQQEFKCTVRFLDDSDPLDITFQRDVSGQWLIDHVCKHLNLVEKDYFGLRYVDTDKQRHWVDPLKPAYKQLKNVSPLVLCFRVKFYPAEPHKLKEEITRYFLFLQLRRDLHHGRLLCPPGDATLLAAYIVQSELGDYDPQDHGPGYVSNFKVLPKQTPKIEERIAELHKGLTGQVPSEAESNFLRKAASLETYGVDPHIVKDQKGNPMYMGVTCHGISTFQGNKRTHFFKWTSINKIAFEGKMFILHLTLGEADLEEYKIDTKKKHVVGFKCPTTAACKHLWRCAVEQQAFFTLPSASQAPKVYSGGGLFRRGSKFRFSGRSQREVLADSENIKRDSPTFSRSSSNPIIVRNHSKKQQKENTLPINFTLSADASGDKADESRDASSPATVSESVDITLDSTLPNQTEVTITSENSPYEPDETIVEGSSDVQDTSAPNDLLETKIRDAEKELEELRNPPVCSTPNHLNEVDRESETSSVEGEPAVVEENIHEKNNGKLTNTELPKDVVPAPPAERSGTATCCRYLTISFVLTFLLLFAAVVFIMEASVESELLTEIKNREEVIDFRVQYYDPARAYVVSLAEQGLAYFQS
ncbi:FERM domain-containing protein 5 isoform X2 [Lingula anatina]|uniref:FERM domain-containing protein 5 isoform X2 n=1 Tax=Lingula anatina TaxID=7574 RepID=A0A1S3K4Y6_LINAN|nr:FERM domain-containing protein 5 isoform X2 [Lingula anatina]|eukprot:XP_013417695.1 FERM domain-containing protein 5 isoform X2 [Lingula anatina]